MPGRRSSLYWRIAWLTVWVLSVFSSSVTTGMPLAVSTTSMLSLVVVSKRTWRRTRRRTAAAASTTSVRFGFAGGNAIIGPNFAAGRPTCA